MSTNLTQENKQIAIVEESDSERLERVARNIRLTQRLMKEVLIEGKNGEGDYGKIDGCGDKPCLFQPGAEKSSLLFGLRAQFLCQTRELPHNHREFDVLCDMYDQNSGVIRGSGVGICTTMEKKYRWQKAERKCPSCGQESIIKGKAEFGGGWLCWTKKGGCGTKFNTGDPSIEQQVVGQVETPDIADKYNTCKKMAYKRAHVNATIRTCAISGLVTQDIDEMPTQVGPIQVVPVEVKTPAKHQKAPSQNANFEADEIPEEWPQPLDAPGDHKLQAEIKGADGMSCAGTMLKNLPEMYLRKALKSPRLKAALTPADATNIVEFLSRLPIPGQEEMNA